MVCITDKELNNFIQTYKDSHSNIDWLNCKINIFIYNYESKKKIMLTSGKNNYKYNEFAIIINNNSSHYESYFENTYFANSFSDIKTIIDYIITNLDIFEFKINEEDALKTKTKRVSLEEIDRIN